MRKEYCRSARASVRRVRVASVPAALDGGAAEVTDSAERSTLGQAVVCGTNTLAPSARSPRSGHFTEEAARRGRVGTNAFVALALAPAGLACAMLRSRDRGGRGRLRRFRPCRRLGRPRLGPLEPGCLLLVTFLELPQLHLYT